MHLPGLVILYFSSLLPKSHGTTKSQESQPSGKTLPIISNILNIPNPLYPVCVVGGGVSGLVVARSLQMQYGKRVVVFEQRQDGWGGKMNTLYDINNANAVWEQGPVLFAWDERPLYDFLTAMELTPLEFAGTNLAAFDPESGQNYNIKQVTLPETEKAMTQGVARYLKIRKENYPPWLFEAGGYTRLDTLVDSHPDLFLTAIKWLQVHDLYLQLEIAMVAIFSCEGYGSLQDLPALYMLKLLTPEITERLIFLPFKTNMTGISTIQEGFREFGRRLSFGIRETILGYKLKRIERNGPIPGTRRLHFETALGRDEESFDCSAVVLAFPPLISKMVGLIEDLSYNERHVLDAIRVHKYFTSGHFMKRPGEDGWAYIGVISNTKRFPQGDGGPISIIHSTKGGNPNAYTIYSWIYGRYGYAPTKEDEDLVSTKLRQFLYAPRYFNKIREGGPVSFIQGHEYFPHVTVDDMRKGFFQNFTCLQGDKGVFYATTATSFESVNCAIDNALYIADKVYHYVHAGEDECVLDVGLAGS